MVFFLGIAIAVAADIYNHGSPTDSLSIREARYELSYDILTAVGLFEDIPALHAMIDGAKEAA